MNTQDLIALAREHGAEFVDDEGGVSEVQFSAFNFYAFCAALTAQPSAEPVASPVTIDFKQATELLAMFGGEPTEITLMPGNGHSGEGLYAVYNADPEGAVYLGQTDEEAVPDEYPVPMVSSAGEPNAASDAASWAKEWGVVKRFVFEETGAQRTDYVFSSDRFGHMLDAFERHCRAIYAPPAASLREPLSDDRISHLWMDAHNPHRQGSGTGDTRVKRFARLIESWHNIGVESAGDPAEARDDSDRGECMQDAESLVALLPGTYYMDPPDASLSPSLKEPAPTPAVEGMTVDYIWNLWRTMSGHVHAGDIMKGDIIEFARTLLAASPVPMASSAGEPVAWLFQCKKPGTHMEYASVDEKDTNHWPLYQWNSVVVTPLSPAASLREQEDAARYRWLRQADNGVCVVMPAPPDDGWVPHTEQLDAAIDAALETQEGKR